MQVERKNMLENVKMAATLTIKNNMNLTPMCRKGEGAWGIQVQHGGGEDTEGLALIAGIPVQPIPNHTSQNC